MREISAIKKVPFDLAWISQQRTSLPFGFFLNTYSVTLRRWKISSGFHNHPQKRRCGSTKNFYAKCFVYKPADGWISAKDLHSSDNISIRTCRLTWPKEDTKKVLIRNRNPNHQIQKWRICKFHHKIATNIINFPFSYMTWSLYGDEKVIVRSLNG